MVGDVKCACCSRLTEEHKMIACSICKKGFFHQCVELTTSELRTIKQKKNLSWSCTECASTSSNGVDELKLLIMSLQSELKELRSVIDKQKVTSETLNFEEVVQEVFDREQRKNNLIIYGIKENNSIQIPTERQNFDKNQVRRVLEVLSYGGDTALIKPIRLGRYDPTKSAPRPIKIRIEDERAVHGLIKNAKGLKNYADLAAVSISPDRTPRQVDYYRQLKTELNRRVADGETGLRIKYFKGIPKIVQEN
nr:unnamed protein product [Callosobruchus analis]